jgi:hypothetical protein
MTQQNTAKQAASRSVAPWGSRETSVSTSRVARWLCTTKANRWWGFSGCLTAGTCASIANGRRPQSRLLKNTARATGADNELTG